MAREFLATGSGAGIRIAVLDSGVEREHPLLGKLELADDLAVIADGGTIKTVANREGDLYGHGTAVCSIIRRLAPQAEIGSFRVLGENLRSRTALVQEGARQAVRRGYHILNCSFGCSREDFVLEYKSWVDEAFLKNRHIVAASNNLDPAKPEWPGHFPTAITVTHAATGGPEVFHHLPGQMAEFAACGENVEVAWRGGGRKKVTGSSFAAPHLTGLLARVLSGAGALGPLQAKALFRQLAQTGNAITAPARPAAMSHVEPALIPGA